MRKGYEIHNLELSTQTAQRCAFSTSCGIAYALTGTLSAMVEGSPVSCRANEYLLFADGEEAFFSAGAPEDSCTLLMMRISRRYLNENARGADDLCACFDNPLLPRFRHVDSHHSGNLLLRDLLSRLARPGSGLFAEETYRHSIAQMVVILAGRAFFSRLPAHAPPGQHTFSLSDLYYYIRDHLHEELSLNQLSENLFFSKYYIAHQFKRQVGIPLHQYILAQKLKLAKAEVLRGVPIAEVYKHCGFGDYSHFIRAYKKAYGITPRQDFLRARSDEAGRLFDQSPSP